MEHVSVVGLGNMGSALASCLLKKGYQVTVWNRTPEKSAPLVAAGATQAVAIADAIAASPIIVVCIKNHQDTHDLLQPIAEQMRGKAICDLSTGNADDAEQLVALLQKNGADCLIGMINAYPSGIGKDSTNIITAGSEDAWSQHTDVIMTLGGSSTYIGSKPSAVPALFAALFTARQGFMFGMIYGSLVSQKAGVPLKVFSDLMSASLELNKGYHNTFATTVPEGNYDNPEASMAVYADALDDALSTFKSSGAPAELPQLFVDKVQDAMKDGLADKQLTALAAHMLK